MAELPAVSGHGSASLVEVEYDGQMYPGVLHAVDAHGMASIRCSAALYNKGSLKRKGFDVLIQIAIGSLIFQYSFYQHFSDLMATSIIIPGYSKFSVLIINIYPLVI
jgi:hypothetical protein